MFHVLVNRLIRSDTRRWCDRHGARRGITSSELYDVVDNAAVEALVLWSTLPERHDGCRLYSVRPDDPRFPLVTLHIGAAPTSHGEALIVWEVMFHPPLLDDDLELS